jgi:hypothetical protein
MVCINIRCRPAKDITCPRSVMISPKTCAHHSLKGQMAFESQPVIYLYSAREKSQQFAIVCPIPQIYTHRYTGPLVQQPVPDVQTLQSSLPAVASSSGCPFYAMKKIMNYERKGTQLVQL